MQVLILVDGLNNGLSLSHTQQSEGGLYVCMNTFLGLSKEFVEVHARKTGNMIFYHIRSVRKPEVPEQKKVEPPEKKPTRLAIGVEGGFDGGEVKKAEFEDHTSIVILPEFQTIPLPNPNLPQKVIVCLFVCLFLFMLTVTNSLPVVPGLCCWHKSCSLVI